MSDLLYPTYTVLTTTLKHHLPLFDVFKVFKKYNSKKSLLNLLISKNTNTFGLLFIH